jgi:hypothetical protein
MRAVAIRFSLSALVTFLIGACATSSPPPGYVWGQVRTAENQPAPNVAVGVARLEDGRTVSPAATTMTDDAGRYLLDVHQLPAGDYVVIVNPGPSMAGGHVGGQTTIALNGPNDSHHLDWTLSANPPVLPDPE